MLHDRVDTSVAENPDRFLAMALSRPAEALAAARAVLASSSPPSSALASVAEQVVGIVLRDFGAIDESITALHAALRWADRSGDHVRTADVRASLGVALVLAGRPRRGMGMLDRSVVDSDGPALGRVLVRRANAFWVLGRPADFLRDADRAVEVLYGDESVWEARALHHRAMARLGVGVVAAADDDFARCEELYQRLGQEFEHATALYERGVGAFIRGDLPAALRHLHSAESVYIELEVFAPELFVSRGTVLLAAGLAEEALDELTAALARLEAQRGSVTRRAELLHCIALAAHAAGHHEIARTDNAAALRLFRRHGRPRWTVRAELLDLQLRASGAHQRRIPARWVERVVARVGRSEPDRTTEAHLVAGRLALSAGRHHDARRHLRRAAAGRHGGIREQAAGWLAQATLAAEAGRPRAVQAACDRGLRVLELRLRALGATELRSLVTAQGTELAAFALRHAVRTGNARSLLEWSERWRAVALTVPPVTPPEDSDLTADLAALRALARRLEAASPGGAEQALLRERRRLELRVRRRALQTPGDGPGVAHRFRCAELTAALGTTDVVELVAVDGRLHAVVITAGKVRLEHLGPVAAAEVALHHVHFALRREAGLRGSIRLDLAAIGADLERQLIGDVARRLRGDAVLVVPPGRLHAVPWGLLPGLRDRVTMVAPSASAWLRARSAPQPVGGPVVLVGGPRLPAGGDEIRALARLHPDAVVLTDGAATHDAVLEAMDGARLVHIAAHGTFRSDSPQFSAIELDDGPLTVYDLERLHRAPHQVVLANCNSAVRSPIGADELLGLTSALVALGAAGVVASVVPVGDAAAVPLMVGLHASLAGGAGLPEALALARTSAGAGAQAGAVACAFVALGC